MAMTSLSPDQYRAAIAKPKRGNKYGARLTVVDGITFHSHREALRWRDLSLMQAAGEISDLARQVRYPLLGANGPLWSSFGRELVYVADFTYFDRATGRQVVEDIKGHQTDLSKLKLAIMAAQGLPVRVVR